MVIDSSALLAIVLGEADADLYVEAIGRAIQQHNELHLPASVIVEAGIVAERRNQGKQLAALIEKIQPEVVPLTEIIAYRSLKVFLKFGKGVHKAGLNFGDCMSYATADYLHASLLFKGSDFEKTPIRSALKI
jgi:ribonuclease VapC